METDYWQPGIIAKLERGIELRDQLQAEQARLRSGEEGDPHQYRSTSNQSSHEDPTVWMRWWLKMGPPPLPLSFAALLGDVIQNLRAALDYSAWAAASEEARTSKPRQISFPLHDDERKYKNWVRERADWFSEDTFRVFEWAQPFQAAEGQLHPLRILQTLSNTDKHQLLNVVDHAHIEVGVELDPMPPTYEWRSADGPVQEGELLAELVFPRPAPALAIDVRPTFGWYECVAYEEPGGHVRWLRIDEMMNEVMSFAVEAAGYMAGARLGLKGTTSTQG